MVMEDTRDRAIDALVSRLAQIEERFDSLEKQLKTHLGTQAGAVTPNMPHPTMSAISRGSWSITNGTTDRTFDANATTVAELADAFYTLIEDLKSIRISG